MQNPLKMIMICMLLVMSSVVIFVKLSEKAYTKVEETYKKEQNIQDKPQKNILYIGNSHTFTHDVPLMVNIILLSMKLNTHHLYRSITQGGVGVKHHWHNPKVQKALDKKYDFVIIQPQSSDILQDIINNINNHPKDFYHYGGLLLNKAHNKTPKTALYQTWVPHLQQPLSLQEQYIPAIHTYNQKMNDTHTNKELPLTIREQIHNVQSNHYARLAYQTRSSVIPVARSWHKAEKQCPNVKLLGTDNHHASIDGAYLISLTIARYINDNKIIPQDVFSPDDMSNNDIKCLVNVVNSNI